MRRSLTIAACLTSILILAGCGGSTPTPPPNTGIIGTITLGPMCPVQQDNQPCPDNPYKASLTLIDQNGNKVLTIESDATGNFQADVAPGTYTLRPEPPQQGLFPIAADQTVIVVAGQYTQVQVVYDTGIR